MDQEKIHNPPVCTHLIYFLTIRTILYRMYILTCATYYKTITSFWSFYVRNIIFKGGYIPCALQRTIYAPVRLGLSNQVVLETLRCSPVYLYRKCVRGKTTE